MARETKRGRGRGGAAARRAEEIAAERRLNILLEERPPKIDAITGATKKLTSVTKKQKTTQ